MMQTKVVMAAVATLVTIIMNLISPLNAQPKGRVAANGIQLYYEIAGHGPYLVLIEGLGVATWLLDKQVPEFSAHFTTVLYDNRGAGKSDKPVGPYSVSLLADDLAALMDTLKIARAHILGASLGGFVALDFALRYPDKVDRLVLVSTSAGGAEHVPMSQETLALVLNTQGEPRELVRKKLALAYSEKFMQGGQVRHLIDLRLQDPQPPQAFMAQAAAGAAFDLSQQVGGIRHPTLISAASKDLLVPVENAHLLHQKIAGSELKIYTGLGHQFFVEAPEQFNRDVIAFLKEKQVN